MIVPGGMYESCKFVRGGIEVIEWKFIVGSRCNKIPCVSQSNVHIKRGAAAKASVSTRDSAGLQGALSYADRVHSLLAFV